MVLWYKINHVETVFEIILPGIPLCVCVCVCVCAPMFLSRGINHCVFMPLSVKDGLEESKLSGWFAGRLHKRAALLAYLRFRWWRRGGGGKKKVKQGE